MALDNTDPSIPLAAGQIQIGDPKQLNAMLQMQLRMQELRQVQQSQNALRQLYSPGNLDELGRPTANAMGQFMQVDPNAGMKLQTQFAQMDEHKLRTDALRGQVTEEHRKTGYEVAKDVFTTYETTLHDTGDDKLANQRAQDRRAELVDQHCKDGSLPGACQKTFMPWDPIKYRVGLSSYEAAHTKPLSPEQQFTMQHPAPQIRKDYRPDGQEIEYQYFPPTPENPQGKNTDLQGNPYTPSGAGKGEPPKITKDEMGRPIIVNPRTGESKPVGGGQQLSEAPSSDLHGDDYLKTLDKGQAEQVKALADGRMAFPSGFALRSPYWQRMLTEVSQYDPAFDAVNYQSRSRTRADLTSGPSAKNITSFNTAIGHLGTLYDKGEKLGNSWSDYYNKLANFVIERKGDPRVREFETAKSAVADELTRSFRLTGGNVHDIVAWEANLNASNSPDQLRGAIRTGVDLLRSRIDALGEQYNKGMGRTSDPLQLLTPKARETLARLPGGEDAKDSKGEKSEAKPNMPTKAADGIFAPKDEGEFDALPSGAAFRKPGDPPDKVRIKP